MPPLLMPSCLSSYIYKQEGAVPFWNIRAGKNNFFSDKIRPPYPLSTTDFILNHCPTAGALPDLLTGLGVALYMTTFLHFQIALFFFSLHMSHSLSPLKAILRSIFFLKTYLPTPTYFSYIWTSLCVMATFDILFIPSYCPSYCLFIYCNF